MAPLPPTRGPAPARDGLHAERVQRTRHYVPQRASRVKRAPEVDARDSGGRRRRSLLVAGCVVVATLAHAVAIDMTEVRRLAQQPARAILRDTPFTDIADDDYLQKVEGSPRPVIVVFYADRDEKSRNLVTLARYLALDFASKIAFFGYRADDGVQVDPLTLQRLDKHYGIKQVPATLFYDNDRGKMELERTHYAVPTLTEYRTPGMLFFKTYYSTIHEYITKHILD